MVSAELNTHRPAPRMLIVLQALSVSLLLAAAPGSVVYAQNAATPDLNVMHQHIMNAKRIAGDDLSFDYYHRCFVDPNYSRTIAELRKAPAAMEPVKVFDNLYFLGQNAVSSWAIQTSQGFILIDTLNNPAEAQQYIEGGMAKLGLDPKQIRYIIITHEHADHFGGAKYLQQKYGAHVMASAVEWKNMPTANRGAGLDPVHDMDVTDGQKFTLGDTTLTFYQTPGHADGTISFIFKVSDRGAPHTVGFFGGMGSPNTEINRDKIIKSFERWEGIAAAAGVDTLIANHQGQDHAVEKLEFIKVRQPGDPNPFVVGADAYHRYFEVQSECTKAALARHGQQIPNS